MVSDRTQLAPPVATPDATAASGPPPSRCDFKHAFFQFFARRNDGWFTFDDNSSEPVFVVSLDAAHVSLAVAGLQRELRLDARVPDDARLLALVAEGVGYVDKIPLGGELPSEVVSGEASWPLPARLLRAGADRLTHHLSEWVETRALGGTPLGVEIVQLAQRLHASIDTDAQDSAPPRVTVPSSTMSEASGRRLAEALGYLLCLRERKEEALSFLLSSVEAATGVFPSQSPAAGAGQALQRALLGTSKRLNGALDEAERMPDIAVAMQQADSTCARIGRRRNAIHAELRRLESLSRAWKGLMITPDRQTRFLLFDTYRKIAQRDLPSQQWATLEMRLAAALLPDGVRTRGEPVSVHELRDLMKKAFIWI
jgi:hypothetical protein